jgi:hypothetical protein
MKKKEENNKAEHVLTDDLLVDKIRKGIRGKGNLGKGDDRFELASAVYISIKKQRITLGSSQKAFLGKRIEGSIHLYRRKKLFYRISSAAVILLLIGISAFYQFNRGSYLQTFAENSQFVATNGHTKLILSGDDEIQINAVEAEISYIGKEKNVEINSIEKSPQTIDNTKLGQINTVVPFGKRTKLILSDNSTIWLNSGSRLTYPVTFAKNKREVYLEGEAIFEVSHNPDHPFVVATYDLDVKVLGTVFNVSAYRDDTTTNTVLVEGAVELAYRGNSFLKKSKISLTPNTLAVYSPHSESITQKTVNTDLHTSWREGYLVFEQRPLGEIIKKLSRYYNVSVALSDTNLANETFSGQLDLKKSALEVLEVIAEIIQLRIHDDGKQILITRS